MKHKSLVSGIQIKKVVLPEFIVSKQSKSTVRRKIKKFCKHNNHQTVFVEKYGVKHIQCVNCGKRIFSPGEDMIFFSHTAKHIREKYGANIFNTAFSSLNAWYLKKKTKINRR